MHDSQLPDWLLGLQTELIFEEEDAKNILCSQMMGKAFDRCLLHHYSRCQVDCKERRFSTLLTLNLQSGCSSINGIFPKSYVKACLPLYVFTGVLAFRWNKSGAANLIYSIFLKLCSYARCSVWNSHPLFTPVLQGIFLKL